MPLYQSKSGTLAVGAPVAILSYGEVFQSIDECPRHMGVQVGLVHTRDAAGHQKRIPKLQVYSFHSCVCASMHCVCTAECLYVLDPLFVRVGPQYVRIRLTITVTAGVAEAGSRGPWRGVGRLRKRGGASCGRECADACHSTGSSHSI